MSKKLKIIDHTHPQYCKRREELGSGRRNGAYFYSKEIVKYIIPRIKTDRNWVTVNEEVEGFDYNHSIVFIHNNLNISIGGYDWLSRYKDVVLVCNIPESCDKVRHISDKVIYLPLSIDTAELNQYRIDDGDKDLWSAYAGRLSKLQNRSMLPWDCDILSGLPRGYFLTAIARYKRVYAVGRCALEAKYLGAEILPCDPRYPDPSIWKVLDNKDAAKILQKELDKIDKKSTKERKK